MTIKLRDFALTVIVLLSSPSMGCSQPLPRNMPGDRQLLERFQLYREAFDRLPTLPWLCGENQIRRASFTAASLDEDVAWDEAWESLWVGEWVLV